MLSLPSMRGAVRLTLCAKEYLCDRDAVNGLFEGDAKAGGSVAKVFELFTRGFIVESVKRVGGVKVQVEGKAVVLKEGVHFRLGH